MITVDKIHIYSIENDNFIYIEIDGKQEFVGHFVGDVEERVELIKKQFPNLAEQSDDACDLFAF